MKSFETPTIYVIFLYVRKLKHRDVKELTSTQQIMRSKIMMEPRHPDSRALDLTSELFFLIFN